VTRFLREQYVGPEIANKTERYEWGDSAFAFYAVLQRLAMILHHLDISVRGVLIWKTCAQALAPLNHPRQPQYKKPSSSHWRSLLSAEDGRKPIASGELAL